MSLRNIISAKLYYSSFIGHFENDFIIEEIQQIPNYPDNIKFPLAMMVVSATFLFIVSRNKSRIQKLENLTMFSNVKPTVNNIRIFIYILAFVFTKNVDGVF